MKIIKSAISILLILMLLLVSIVPVFATELSSGTLNLWDNDYFESRFNLDREKFKNFESLVNEKLQDRKVNNSLMYFQNKSEYDIRFFMILTDGLISVEHWGSNLFIDVFSDCTYVLYLQVNYESDKNVYLSQANLIETTSYSLERMAFSDKISNYYTSEDVEFSNNSNLMFYKSENIYYDLLRWINNDNYCDVLENLGSKWIKHYNIYSYDNYFYGKGNFDNNLNSTVSFSNDCEIYYSKTHQDDVVYTPGSQSYQQQEILKFYIKITIPFTGVGGYSVDDINVRNYVSSVTTCKNYKLGKIDFFDWLDTTKGLKNTNVSIEKIGINYYFCWNMANVYSSVGPVLSGWKTSTNVPTINPKTGETGGAVGGIGSNVDTSDIPSKSDLLSKGFKNGYPNQNGNYPYCITVNINGVPAYKFYYKEKPKVSSYLYSYSQIQYTVDVKTAVGYVYVPSLNVSKQFDYNKIKSVSNEDIQYILNSVSAGLSIASIATASVPVEIVSCVVDLISFCDFSSLSTDSILNRELCFWTNFTGTKQDYNGYLITFNWDIGVDGAFVRDNSDDDYNYSDDYISDVVKPENGTETATDKQGNIISGNNYYYTYNYYYSDNNGNVHGGGDDTYIATEPPTASDLVYGNVDNFDFSAPTLWNYSDSIFAFIAQAFTFLPAWIWLLVASGIVLVISLRLLGR